MEKQGCIGAGAFGVARKLPGQAGILGDDPGDDPDPLSHHPAGDLDDVKPLVPVERSHLSGMPVDDDGLHAARFGENGENGARARARRSPRPA